MDATRFTEDDKVTVPEVKFYKWEGVKEMTTSEVRALLSTRAKTYEGKAREVHAKVLEAFNNLWAKQGFDYFPTNRLKAMLVAAAQDVGWYRTAKIYMQHKPKQPADSNFKTCPTCLETKPKAQFTRKVSAKRAKQYGWREDSRIRIPHEQCNYCASPKRVSIAPKRTTPSIAKLRNQIKETLKVARRMNDSAYKELKIKLLEQCRERLSDYLTRGVRGPDSWEMMLSKEERNELESLHRRVHWTRRVPAVF